MNIIETTAPIKIEDLKKYFLDKTIFYKISYSNSSLKGKKLLTYLSNLEIPADIDFTGCSDESFFEILDDYFRLETICNIAFLEKAAIAVLKERLGISKTSFFKEFIDNRIDIIDEWIDKIYSLSLYNMYCIDVPEFKEFVERHPIDQTESLIGINFVSVLKHDELFDLYQTTDTNRLKFYKNYFEQYMFKGKNLYHYWANDNNPLFLLTWAIASGEIDSDTYFHAVKEDIEFLESK